MPTISKLRTLESELKKIFAPTKGVHVRKKRIKRAKLTSEKAQRLRTLRQQLKKDLAPLIKTGQVKVD